MSIATEITRLQGAKADLKTSINAKTDDQHKITNETIDEYADFVDSISTGGDEPTYDYRELPQEYAYYTSLKSTTDDSAFLVFSGSGGESLAFGQVSSSTSVRTTITVYGGSNGTTPLYKWESRDGWYHYNNGSWVKNTKQPSSTTVCVLAEMDLDNYPLPRGIELSDLIGKHVIDERIGETELFTVIVSGYKVRPNQVNPTGASGTSGYYRQPVLAYSGLLPNVRQSQSTFLYDLEFLDFKQGTSEFSQVSYQLANLYNLKSVELPLGVTSLQTYCFRNNNTMQKFTAKDEITSVGQYAFESCGSLKEIDLSHATTLGTYVLQNCKNLKKVKLSNQLTEIPNFAFYENNVLEEINIPNSLTTIGNDAFYNCKSLPTISIPNTVTSIGEACFFGTNVKDITIPNGVTTMPNACFQDCESLEHMQIPSTVTSIGTNCFSGCSALQEIELPSSLTALSANILSNCFSLKKLTIPTGITSIGASCFSGCSSLKEVELPNDLPAIGQSMFNSCASLTKMIIPASVLTIATTAFSGCGKILYYKMESSTPPTLSNVSAFGTGNSYCKIFVPYLAYYSYQTATNWSSSTNNIKAKQRGWGYFTQGTTLPTTLGNYTLHWYDLDTIINTTYSAKPTTGEITVAPADGEYYCFYE